MKHVFVFDRLDSAIALRPSQTRADCADLFWAEFCSANSQGLYLLQNGSVIHVLWDSSPGNEFVIKIVAVRTIQIEHSAFCLTPDILVLGQKSLELRDGSH